MFPISGVKPKEFPPLAAAFFVIEMGIGWKELVAETLP